MKVLVCVKQVPDMGGRFRPNGAGDWYSETDLVFRMNDCDENAVEQAVQLKEQLGGQPEVTVLSVGPARAGEVIRKALAMGCDRGVHVQDDAAAQRDPWQIASIIAGYARGRGFDLVLTGMQSQDRGSAQVGVFVAEMLGIACATTLVGLALDGGGITAKRELEGGCRGLVRLQLPALLTCQLGLNVPRYPTLPNIMKAKKKPLDVVPAAQLLEADPRASTTRFFEPAKKSRGQILEGAVEDLIERLVATLREKTPALR